MTSTTTESGTTKKAAAAIETVTMKDGRTVDFVGKRKMLKEAFIKDGAISIRLDFRNAETRTFTIPDSLLSKFAAHGAEQKLGDETAGLDDVDDAVMAVDALIERLNAGEWGVKREANGMAGTSVLARALVEVMGKPIEAIRAFLEKKNQAEKVALRNNPRVKPVVERIEAEKASKKSAVNTDAMLDELGGLGDAPATEASTTEGAADTPA